VIGRLLDLSQFSWRTCGRICWRITRARHRRLIGPGIGIKITAPRATSRDIKRHKASNYRSG
jgi:hypothetical protein